MSIPATADSPVPASGEQFRLRYGRATAGVGAVAAVLREFSVGGVHFTETWADEEPAPCGCGIVLSPWPNRVAQGRWTHDGKPQQLDITEPARGSAIHGLLRNHPYTATEITDTAVTLTAPIYPQHGYPFAVHTWVRYELAADGLTVTHGATNLGTGMAPYGVGAHPFLKISTFPTADLRLTASAATYVRVDEALIPVAEEAVDATPYDLRHGPRVGDLALDTAYTDLSLIDGEYRTELTAPDGTGLQLWADENFGWLQVFTTDVFPGIDCAVAVEPMTCNIDAFNNGRGLITLAPGESFQGSWGLRPIGFDLGG